MSSDEDIPEGRKSPVDSDNQDEQDVVDEEEEEEAEEEEEEEEEAEEMERYSGVPIDLDYLAKLEELAKDRYTDKDEDYVMVRNREYASPPLVELNFSNYRGGGGSKDGSRRWHNSHDRYGNRNYDRHHDGRGRQHQHHRQGGYRDNRRGGDRRGYGDNQRD